MSLRVLVIPENPSLDQHVLKPVVARIFEDLNRRATIEILQDPCLDGVTQALDKAIIEELLRDNPMIDLFLLVVDRDCELGRQDAVNARMRDAAALGKCLLGCVAIEELEVWALALHRDELGHGWADVRKECHPKEAFFDPLVKRSGWLESKGRGRATAMQELAGKWRSLKSVCGEIQELENAIGSWLEFRRC